MRREHGRRRLLGKVRTWKKEFSKKREQGCRGLQIRENKEGGGCQEEGDRKREHGRRRLPGR